MTFSLWGSIPNTKKYRKGKINQASSLNLTKTPIRPSRVLLAKAGELSRKIIFYLTERMSPRSSFLKAWGASMTVEASLVLPLFLLFFLTLGSGMEMMRFHGKMEVALWEIGRETCLYGSVLQNGALPWSEKDGQSGEEKRQILSAVGNLTFSYASVKPRVEAILGAAYLADAPVANGAKGLWYLGGSVLTKDDLVELAVTYEVQPKWAVQGFRGFWLENQYYGRLWTGYELSETENTLYYLTENAEVYHLSLDCSHLNLKPEQIPAGSLAGATNAKGSHYRACSFCVKGEDYGVIWVSPEGDCYHYRRDCLGLKRTIRAVRWEEAKAYRPCSRCGTK